MTGAGLGDTSELLFILGGPKTATSSLCGLLNSHPDIFVMYEVFLNQSYPSRYARKLLRHSPGMQPFFLHRFGGGRLDNYLRAHEWLRSQGFAGRYFGDKFADIDTGYAETMRESRVVYCVRPLPEWVAKGSVRAWYPLDANVVPCAVQYTKHFLESFLLPKVFHVRMDDFLATNDRLVDSLWAFLEVDPPERRSSWWETIGKYPPEDPKIAITWWKGHMSSAVPPLGNDTKVELKETAFWSDILPLFDRYYKAAGQGERPSRSQVEADLRNLDTLVAKYQFSIEESYAALDSKARGKAMKLKHERKRRIGKVLKLFSFGR